MAIRSLNRFRQIRLLVTGMRRKYLRWRYSLSIAEGTSLSLSATLIPGRAGGIEVGTGSLIAFKSLLLAQLPGGEVRPIRIGRNCFIGGGAVILPGVTIGDGSIIGAGAVVFEDVPARCIAVGNPARVIQEGINTGRFGRLDYADDNSRRLSR